MPRLRVYHADPPESIKGKEEGALEEDVVRRMQKDKEPCGGLRGKVNKYEGKYICGYCGKITPISDEKVEEIIQNDEMDYAICGCGHFSYASKIRAKFKCNFKDWRFVKGSIKKEC